MSHSSSRLRGLGLAGLAALAALAAAPAAGATAVALEATCDFGGFLPAKEVTVGLEVADSVVAGGGGVPLYTVTSVRNLPIFEPTSPSLTLDATLTPSSGPAQSLSNRLPTWGLPVAGPVFPNDVPAGPAQLQFTGLVINAPGGDGGDPASWDAPCTLKSTTPSATIQVGAGDALPPTRPGPLSFEASGPGAVTVSWGASTDNVGVSKYRVILAGEGRSFEVTPPQTSTTVTGLVPGQLLDARVEAVDAAGNRSQLSTGRIRVGDGVILDPYGVPSELRVVKTSTTVALSWNVNSAFVPPSFDVFQDGVRVKTVSDRGVAIGGLTPGQTYTFAVASMSGTLQLGVPTPITVTLPSSSARTYTWGLTGSATVPTLVKGSVPLKGLLGLDVDEAGAVTGNLALLESTVRLASGFLPLTGKVAFIASGRTTGTYAADVLKTTSKVRIKVVSVKLFGAIPLVIGNSCQTRSLTDLKLTSEAGFSLATGGTLGGQFALSDLNGCGPLSGLVSPLTAGADNTITLQAKAPTPQAS